MVYGLNSIAGDASAAAGKKINRMGINCKVCSDVHIGCHIYNGNARAAACIVAGPVDEMISCGRHRGHGRAILPGFYGLTGVPGNASMAGIIRGERHVIAETS